MGESAGEDVEVIKSESGTVMKRRQFVLGTVRTRGNGALDYVSQNCISVERPEEICGSHAELSESGSIGRRTQGETAVLDRQSR